MPLKGCYSAFAVKPDLIQGATIADKMQTAVSEAGIVDFVRKASTAKM